MPDGWSWRNLRRTGLWGYFFAPEPANAVATPSEISIPPDTYRCVRNQRVFRFR